MMLSSCGPCSPAFSVSMEEAAKTALSAIRDYLSEGSGLKEVRIVLFDDEALKVWRAAFEDILR